VVKTSKLIKRGKKMAGFRGIKKKYKFVGN
jgi:hypothetical protein